MAPGARAFDLVTKITLVIPGEHTARPAEPTRLGPDIVEMRVHGSPQARRIAK